MEEGGRQIESKAEVIDGRRGKKFRIVPDFGHCLIRNATHSQLCMKLNLPGKMTQNISGHLRRA